MFLVGKINYLKNVVCVCVFVYPMTFQFLNFRKFLNEIQNFV